MHVLFREYINDVYDDDDNNPPNDDNNNGNVNMRMKINKSTELFMKMFIY